MKVCVRWSLLYAIMLGGRRDSVCETDRQTDSRQQWSTVSRCRAVDKRNSDVVYICTVRGTNDGRTVCVRHRSFANFDRKTINRIMPASDRHTTNERSVSEHRQSSSNYLDSSSLSDLLSLSPVCALMSYSFITSRLCETYCTLYHRSATQFDR